MTQTNTYQDLYLKEVGNYLPYGKQKNDELVQTIREDLQEQNIAENLHNLYGDPKEVAKNIATIHQESVYDAHWVPRLIAYIVDILLITGAAFIAMYLPFILMGEMDLADDIMNESFSDLEISMALLVVLLIYLTGSLLFFVSYFFYMEKLLATTIGKQIFGLRVIDESGIKIGWKQSIVRNITKIQGEFLPFDILLGWLMKKEQGGRFRRATEIASESRVVQLR
ncbi:MAG: RDD family protein [Candidatus Kariarchaeaceae archaeon]|jgi:uncharacterized RDD family membrane protein YckC